MRYEFCFCLLFLYRWNSLVCYIRLCMVFKLETNRYLFSVWLLGICGVWLRSRNGLRFFFLFFFVLVLRSEKGKIKYRKDKRGPYYHLIAWSFPLVLTITIMAFGEVDGDSLLGVCYVGVINKQFRLFFLLGPLACSVVGLVLFAKGLYDART